MNRARALVIGGFLAFAVSGCATAIENSIVFQPRKYPTGDWAPTPGIEDVWIESSDGVRLNGWLARAERPQAVVLYTHGNGGNITTRREVLRLFRDRLNASVMVFDYRGYGKSGGAPTETGVLDDARAARRYLAATCGVRESDVVLVGTHSGAGWRWTSLRWTAHAG